MPYPDDFHFLSVNNITKLERFHQAASRAITGCLLSSPISFLLSSSSSFELFVVSFMQEDVYISHTALALMLTEATLSFSGSSIRSGFSAEACSILQAIR